MGFDRAYARSLTTSRWQIGDLTVHADHNGEGWTIYTWLADACTVTARRPARSLAAAAVWDSFVVALAASWRQRQHRSSGTHPPADVSDSVRFGTEPTHERSTCG